VLERYYGMSCDTWSCGIILHVLLLAAYPFRGATDELTESQIRSASIDFEKEEYQNISADAIDLMRRLLKRNPRERTTAAQAMKHKWVLEKEKVHHTSLSESKSVGDLAEVQSAVMCNFRSLKKSSTMRNVALHVVASQLTDSHVKGLRDVFISLDINGDGHLSHEEFNEGLRQLEMKDEKDSSSCGFDASTLENMFHEIDTDNSGHIDYTEFLAAAVDRKVALQDDLCWAAFSAFDRDRSGRISREEISAVLGSDSVQHAFGYSAEQIGKLIDEHDTDGDGEIDFNEFMAMMRADAELPERHSVAYPGS